VLINPVPLEDELGDVLDKALRHAGLTEDVAALRAGVDAGKIRDAIDYRYDLSGVELRRLAAVLRLNEVGLCALAQEHYPLPEIGALPFSVWPLRMTHGIGVANAYLVTEPGARRGLLFDVGRSLVALSEVWPGTVDAIDAVFLTHVEDEHTGALCDVVARFGIDTAFVPTGAKAPCGRPMGEGEIRTFGDIEVTAFATPGHCAAHNCYLVQRRDRRGGGPLLISGDLIFAGSVGGGYFCHKQLHLHLRRLLEAVPPSAVIAPGHGPLSTVENELKFNPFVV
jgi:hydroxyacylglutathione hydrolase